MSSSKLVNIELQVITRQTMRFVWDILTECWLQAMLFHILKEAVPAV